MITHETNEPEYCTVAEAAQMLHVSKPTVWRWIQSKRLRVVRIGPRVVRIWRGEIDRLAGGRGEAANEPWWKRYAIQLGDPMVSEDELMAEIEAINDEILARRGGEPLESSVPLIHESRR